jgi:DNA-binding transcriptional LysR family regulator
MIPELRTFIAVVRHGSFAAAGERIGLTQSAVSSQIRRLEAELGFALFERTGRSATLNEAGVRTLARAEELVARFSRLGEPGDGPDAPALLRIGAIASAQSTLVARAMPAFRALHPTTRVRLVPGVSMQMMDQMDGDQLDAAVMVRPPFALPAGLAWQPLVRESYALLVPPRTPGDDWRTLIESLPFLRYERTSFGGRQVARFLHERGCRLQEAMEVDEIPALIAMVKAGLGAAIVPLSESCLPLPRQVRAVSLGNTTLSREIGVVARRGSDQHPALADWVRCLAGAV